MAGSRCERLTSARRCRCSGAGRVRIADALAARRGPAPGAKRRRSAPLPDDRRARSGRGAGAAISRATGTPLVDQRDIDGEFVAAGQEFARAVERIDQQETSPETVATAASAASSETTGTPGSSRARPARMMASEASSAAVTGDDRALSRGRASGARHRQDRRAPPARRSRSDRRAGSAICGSPIAQADSGMSESRLVGLAIARVRGVSQRRADARRATIA